MLHQPATAFAVCLASLALLASGCTQIRRPDDPSHYRVQADCAGVPRCHQSIQAALDAAEQDARAGWVIVDVAPGDYREKVTIRRALTLLRGSGQSKTRLHFDAVAENSGRYHRRNWGTPGSATLTIDADQVTVSGFTLENTFDFLANDALPDGHAAKLSNSQAVALLLDIHSDRVYLHEVALLGFQDTLFANGRRALIRRSLIAGNVDFIFGGGQLLIEDSVVRSRPRAAALPAGELESFITAPSTQLSQLVGIVVYRSRLEREPGVRDGAVALGRPWHPTTTFADGRYADPDAVGQASFIDCFMDAHISRDGWSSMNGTARSGAKTDVFLPQDSRFFEFGSHGPGAQRKNIGIKWQEHPRIEEIRRIMFEGWPDPGH